MILGVAENTQIYELFDHTPNSAFMDFGYVDFSIIWTILFQYIGYMAFCFMDFSLIWTILAGTDVVHISGIGFDSA